MKIIKSLAKLIVKQKERKISFEKKVLPTLKVYV